MIKKFDVEITPFQLGRRIHIYLPDDYEQSEERYPVIYMYDGHNLFYDSDATYGKSWGIKDFLDNYDKKFIVVGMECNHEGSKRLDEYCPYTLSQSHLGNIQGQGVEYMEWVVNELKPYIDEKFYTLKDKDNTGIGGSSMGGLFSFYLGLKYKESIGFILSFSPAFLLYKEKEFLNELKNSNLNPNKTGKIFFWTGGINLDKEIKPLTIKAYNCLYKMGFNSDKCRLIYDSCGDHNEQSWRLPFKQALQWWKYQ